MNREQLIAAGVTGLLAWLWGHLHGTKKAPGFADLAREAALAVVPDVVAAGASLAEAREVFTSSVVGVLSRVGLSDRAARPFVRVAVEHAVVAMTRELNKLAAPAIPGQLARVADAATGVLGEWAVAEARGLAKGKELADRVDVEIVSATSETTGAPASTSEGLPPLPPEGEGSPSGGGGGA